MTVKLSSVLPKGDANGLDSYDDEFRLDGAVYAIVALVQTDRLTSDLAGNGPVPTLAIRAVELVTTGTDEKSVRRILRAQYVERTGNSELPNLEDAIQAILNENEDKEK